MQNSTNISAHGQTHVQKHTVISIDTGRTFGRIQNLLTIKAVKTKTRLQASAS